MPRRPAPLPPALADGPFSVAAATASNVSYRRLRHPSLLAPTVGARTTQTPASALMAAQVIATPRARTQRRRVRRQRAVDSLPDFLWRRPRVIAEYHGDVHRTDRATWQSGFTRRQLAEDNGWRMIEFTARDVFANSPRLELLTLLAELLLGPGAGGCALDVASRLG